MVWETFLDTIFNPWLGQALNLPAFWAILIISAFITVLVTVVYKYTTNQREMKQIKDDLKKYQKEMREIKDTKKLMATQKKALDLNMKYMKSSFKSTLYTFIPIIVIFAWLNMHIAYYPITPNTNFTVTATFVEDTRGNATLINSNLKIDQTTKEITDNKVVWIVNGEEGKYDLKISDSTKDYTKKVHITSSRTYEMPEELYKGNLQKIQIGNKVVHPFGETFNLFGWYPGWLATYIVLSIALSAVCRKLFNVY